MRASEGIEAIAREGGWEALVEMCRLKACWPEVVGDAVAAHAQPERLVRGRLTVVVDNSAWLTQLAFLKNDIQRKVNAHLGEGRVNDVFMVVGRLSRPKSAPKPPPAPPVSPELAREVESWVGEVADEEVRDALRAMIQNGLRHGRRPSR
ncbi:MAG: DciA family protein [Leptospirillia bacterium]